MKNKKNAFDYVKKEINYDRPLFNFPDLSSPDGNAYNFWPIIHSKLNELGFRKEAKVFGDRMGFMKYKYEDIIQLVAYFLDFNPENDISNKNNVIKEDKDYVYIKVKKELYHPETNLKQPVIFKVKDLETFKEMAETEDFSIKNCYGRTFLNYIDNPILMSCFLELNEKHHWIDLIDLDNFCGSYLHSASNIECFSLLFNAISQEDPKITDRFLFGTDVFGNSAYSVLIHLLSENIQKKEDFIQAFTNHQTIETLSQIFTCLEKVNPEEYEFLKKQFSSKEDICSYLKESPEAQDNLNKLFLFVKLDNKLTPSEKPSKIKNKI